MPDWGTTNQIDRWNRQEPTNQDSRTYYVDLSAALSLDGGRWIAKCRELPIAAYEPSPEAARDSLQDAIRLTLERHAEHGELERYLADHGVPWGFSPKIVVSRDNLALDASVFYAFFEVPVSVRNLVHA